MRRDFACLGGSHLWLGGVGMKQAKCPECKKKFMHSPEHAYRRNDKYLAFAEFAKARCARYLPKELRRIEDRMARHVKEIRALEGELNAGVGGV